MNCQEFQAAIGAQPNSTDPEALAHAAACADCARHREELQAMDRVIYRALNIDMAPLAPRAVVWRRPVWGMAASALLAIFVAAALWIAGSRESLAEQLIDHVEHEAASLVRTSQRVDAVELAGMLERLNMAIKPGAAHVSYAMTCEFRGHRVPHLVMQTEQGPVTVMILAEEPTPAGGESFDEEGFRGMILPAPRGAVAVLRQAELGNEVPIDVVAKNLQAALDYGW
jgi:hypothetical protein